MAGHKILCTRDESLSFNSSTPDSVCLRKGLIHVYVAIFSSSTEFANFTFLVGNIAYFLLPVLWILMSTICLGQFFLYLAELNTERRQNALVKWVLTRRVTIVDLEAADMDNDGVVDATEFVLFKLKEMGKITQNDISLVMKGFEELDVDQSGTLLVYDLQQLAS